MHSNARNGIFEKTCWATMVNQLYGSPPLYNVDIEI